MVGCGTLDSTRSDPQVKRELASPALEQAVRRSGTAGPFTSVWGAIVAVVVVAVAVVVVVIADPLLVDTFP